MHVGTDDLQSSVQLAEMLGYAQVCVLVRGDNVDIWLQLRKICDHPIGMLRLRRTDLPGFLVHGLVYDDRSFTPIDVLLPIQSEELADA